MIINDKLKNKFEQLAKSSYAPYIIEYIDAIIADVSDVRKDIKVKSEIEKDVRLGIAQILQESLIDKIKSLRGELDPPSGDDYR